MQAHWAIGKEIGFPKNRLADQDLGSKEECLFHALRPFMSTYSAALDRPRQINL